MALQGLAAQGMSEETAQAPRPTLPLTVESPIAWAEFVIDHVELRKFYRERGVRCFDCCAAEIESIAKGAQVHAGGPHGAFDAAQLVADLNELAKKHPFSEATAYNPGLLARLLDFLFPSKS